MLLLVTEYRYDRRSKKQDRPTSPIGGKTTYSVAVRTAAAIAAAAKQQQQHGSSSSSVVQPWKHDAVPSSCPLFSLRLLPRILQLLLLLLLLLSAAVPPSGAAAALLQQQLPTHSFQQHHRKLNQHQRFNSLPAHLLGDKAKILRTGQKFHRCVA